MGDPCMPTGCYLQTYFSWEWAKFCSNFTRGSGKRRGGAGITHDTAQFTSERSQDRPIMVKYFHSLLTIRNFIRSNFHEYIYTKNHNRAQTQFVAEHDPRLNLNGNPKSAHRSSFGSTLKTIENPVRSSLMVIIYICIPPLFILYKDIRCN
jgi:hypothetical protein